MSEQETATQTANAEEITESATVEETEQQEESTETPEETADEGSQPTTEHKVDVKELIAERKKKQVARQEAAYWKGKADATSLQTPKVSEEPQRQLQSSHGAPAEPASDNFDSWDDYEKAHARYLVDLAKHEIRQEQHQYVVQQQRATQQSRAQEERANFETRIEKAAESNPTILSIMEDETLPLHTSALPLVYDSEVAPELLLALNKDRKEATRIFHLFNSNPILAARELGKLEAKLMSAPKPVPPKRVSQAPSPISTVKGSGSGLVDEANLPIDQWIARRNKAEFGK